jgi:TonB family protein
VLAELERTELEESQLVKAKQEVSEPAKATPTQPAAKADAPVSSSRKQGRKKTSSLLAATLMLALTAGGFYAAWNYQPGVRAIAQPQIDRFLTVVGMALPPTSATSPAKRSKPVAPSTSTVPASTSPGQGSAAGSVTGSATSSAAGPATTSAAASAPVPATPSAAVAPPLSGAANASAPTVAKPEVSKASTIQKDTAATQLDTPLPGENSAIILSSKGAEKRLAQTVPPKYPVGAASGEAEGTVVLKEVVDENGKVEGVRLVEGNATLAAAAINAVKQWRYRPYIRDGKAEPFQTVVIVDFQRP